MRGRATVAGASLLSVELILAAAGNLVDTYDLMLFSVVRVASLRDLGLAGAAVTDQGLLLLNVQMLGMLVGGVWWGMLGDRRGRLSVLFGSILLYSLANLGNGLVHDVGSYAACRLLAGIGLAGELFCATRLAETFRKDLDYVEDA